jgi:hypothetical protein
VVGDDATELGGDARLAPTRVGPGEVFVVGDHRSEAVARQVVGRLPVSEVRGLARQLAGSVAPDGRRRSGRTGRSLDPHRD